MLLELAQVPLSCNRKILTVHLEHNGISGDREQAGEGQGHFWSILLKSGIYGMVDPKEELGVKGGLPSSEPSQPPRHPQDWTTHSIL